MTTARARWKDDATEKFSIAERRHKSVLFILDPCHCAPKSHVWQRAFHKVLQRQWHERKTFIAVTDQLWLQRGRSVCLGGAVPNILLTVVSDKSIAAFANDKQDRIIIPICCFSPKPQAWGRGLGGVGTRSARSIPHSVSRLRWQKCNTMQFPPVFDHWCFTGREGFRKVVRATCRSCPPRPPPPESWCFSEKQHFGIILLSCFFLRYRPSYHGNHE